MVQSLRQMRPDTPTRIIGVSGRAATDTRTKALKEKRNETQT